MLLDNVTIAQYQELHDIITNGHFESNVERNMRLLACLEGKDPEYYNDLSIDDFAAACQALDFLNKEPEPKAVERWGRWRFTYHFADLTAGQYIDILHFSQGDYVPNLHKILASFAVPCRRTWYGAWKAGKYGDVPHDQAAEAFLKMPVGVALGVALFFSRVWNGFIKDIKDYLTAELPTTTPAERQALERLFISGGAGSPTSTP